MHCWNGSQYDDHHSGGGNWIQSSITPQGTRQDRLHAADITTHKLPAPFLVLATQNPVELEGTFPLPEAQLDRFIFKLGLGYLSAEEESNMLLNLGGPETEDDVEGTLLQGFLFCPRRCEVRSQTFHLLLSSHHFYL